MSDYPDLNGKTRDDAWVLLAEWVQTDSLRKHCLSVETAMRAYAERLGEDVEAWGMLGLLHDFDYERYPNLDDHTKIGSAYLRDNGWPDWLADALLAHGYDDAYPRTTLYDRALFSVDELTGFVAAVALVRPSKAVADVKVSSVTKKLKDKAFAAAIHRDELRQGAEEFDVDFNEHIAVIIEAMSANAEVLGLAGISSGQETDA
ncbi:MAG: HDIG domain-containing protein [Thermomicrobiales bacterium]|nr:HDIG domain-containing protein [Thermomicrobiales bacterium]MCO5223815.1 HDIG domain-containing protein [Thermomicrobiales bacterium]MCO5228485.1 HDIG domain-containing protein [Thermomicrobiales bacterium]